MARCPIGDELTATGHTRASLDRRQRSGTCISVCLAPNNFHVALVLTFSSFCIAPLDVIKIRLQLQTHSLSDPLSHYGYSGPVYKGTLGTLRAILQQEGLTVRHVY